MFEVIETPQFALELEALLPYDRTEDRPSIADFEQYDFLSILEKFAVDWLNLPPVPGDNYYRWYFGRGLVIPMFTVTGHMMADGRIELIGISIDWDLDPDMMTD